MFIILCDIMHFVLLFINTTPVQILALNEYLCPSDIMLPQYRKMLTLSYHINNINTRTTVYWKRYRTRMA